MTEAESYARWVLEPENHFRTGELMKKAARRFLKDLEREDIYFDVDQANIPIQFIEENLYHWEDKWRGKPVILEPWQKFIIQQIYGWIVVETGLRRVRFVFIETGKKNSKTAMGAFFSLFHLFADRINSPKVFVGANNHEQANICVNYAGKTIENSPDLYDWVEDGTVLISKYNGKIHTIVHNERDGFIETMAKEPSNPALQQAGGKHGKSPSLVIIDEYAMADSDSLLNAMENAQGAREEPLTVCITTAGPKKDGPCHQKLRDSGIKVLDGVLEDDTYLPFIFEMDKPIGPEGKPVEITVDYLMDHPEVWPQSNPNYKVSVFDIFLKTQLTKAKNERGTKEVDVLTFNFNLWVDSAEVFIPADVWNSNTFGEEPGEGAECYGGLEIATGTGMSAFVLYFPGEKNKLKTLFWMPSEGARTDVGFDGYARWIKDGFIKVDPGNVVDNDLAVEWIVNFISQYNMNSFSFPKPFENNSIVQTLVKHGFHGQGISQAVNTISAPTTQWEQMFLARKMDHYGNPVLAWSNSNCMVVRKEQGIRIEKNQKVLPIYACLNALTRHMASLVDATNDQTIEIW